MNFLIIFTTKYLLYVAVAVAVIYFFRQPRAKKKEIFIFAVILFPLSYIIAKVAGHFFYDPRPFVIGNFTPLIGHAPDNGFPSDHTLLAAAVAFAIFHFNKKLGLFLFFLAVLIGLARVLAGVHHAVDIMGSFAIVGAIYLLLADFPIEAII